jgi:hypothetical protein
VDPHHTHVVAVDHPGWPEAMRAQGWTPDDGYWGSETAAMFALFDRLAAGRPSVAIVANGGSITLDEVQAHAAANRPMVVVAGSGRAADALVSSLHGTPPPDDDSRALRDRADALHLTGRCDMFHLFDLASGPGDLARLLEHLLVPR